MKKYFLALAFLTCFMKTEGKADPGGRLSIAEGQEIIQKTTSRRVQKSQEPPVTPSLARGVYTYLKNWPTNAYGNTKKILSGLKEYAPLVAWVGSVAVVSYLTPHAEARDFPISFYTSRTSTGFFADCLQKLTHTYPNARCIQTFGGVTQACKVMNWSNQRLDTAINFVTESNARNSLAFCESVLSEFDATEINKIVQLARP